MKQLAKTFLHGHCKPTKLQDFKENRKHFLLNTLNVCRAARTENTALQQLLLPRNNSTNLKNSLYLFNKQRKSVEPSFPTSLQPLIPLLLSITCSFPPAQKWSLIFSLAHLLAMQEGNWQYIAWLSTVHMLLSPVTREVLAQ